MQGQLMTFYNHIYRMWMFVFSDLASAEHEIMKTLRHLIIISFINCIKPYTNTIKRFGRPIYRTQRFLSHSHLSSHSPTAVIDSDKITTVDRI